jgi:predicted nuclease of predicted toxin-antitoxin system
LKLLFDQNISPKIIKSLGDDFLGSNQVRFLGLENASDLAIFDFAKNQGFTLVTFDSDFVDLNIVKGIPPKIIWLRSGNQTTISISTLIIKNKSTIESFILSDEDEILELHKTFED